MHISPVNTTDAEWRQKLSEQEYQILREGKTEKPHTGEFVDHKPVGGYYICRGCQSPLFSASAKFDSGCGWPSFDKCYFSNDLNGCHVKFLPDDSVKTRPRIEITCVACDGHLGHIFFNEDTRDNRDGDDERFCVNSASIKYIKTEPEYPGLYSLSSRDHVKKQGLLLAAPAKQDLENIGVLEEVKDLI